MENRRRLLRLEVSDFLEVKALNEVGSYSKGKSENLTPMGICFSSGMNWHKGQVLLINYFIPAELESVQLKVIVVWSELIGTEEGYFCGGEILAVEKGKEDKFAHYYFQKLKQRRP